MRATGNLTNDSNIAASNTDADDGANAADEADAGGGANTSGHVGNTDAGADTDVLVVTKHGNTIVPDRRPRPSSKASSSDKRQHDNWYR